MIIRRSLAPTAQMLDGPLSSIVFSRLNSGPEPLVSGARPQNRQSQPLFRSTVDRYEEFRRTLRC
jgi:hypothetical protein